MLYLDTNEFSQFLDDVSRKTKTAKKLSDKIYNIKRLAYVKYDLNSSSVLKLQRLVKESDVLINYYYMLSSALNQTSFDAKKMMTKSNQTLNEYLIKANSLINKTIENND